MSLIKTGPVSLYEKKGELALQILRVLAMSALLGAALVCPNLVQVIKLFRPKNQLERQRLQRSVQSLERRGFVSYVKGDRIQITQKGRTWAEFDSLTISKKKWDGKWRVFMFDVPEKKKQSRMLLSKKVQEMGMVFLQKSVFVSPYPCEEELIKVCTFLRVLDHVQLLIVTKMYGEDRLMKKFGLSKSNS